MKAKKYLATLLLGLVVFNALSNVSYAAEATEVEATEQTEVTGNAESADAVDTQTEDADSVDDAVTEDGTSEEEALNVVEGNELLYGTSSSTATSIYAGKTVTDGWTDAGEAASSLSHSDYYNAEHWYKYTTTKRGYFTVNLKQHSSDASGWWNIYVYEQGNASPLEYDQIATTENFVSKRICVNSGKTFLIKVTDFYYSKGNYDLTVNQTAASNWETEGNDSFSTATPFVNGEIYGTTYKQGDHDYYSFTVTKKSKVQLQLLLEQANLTNVESGWYAQIYKAGDSTYLAENYNLNSEVVWNVKSRRYSSDLDGYPDLVLDPGTYYIKWEALASYTNIYNQPYHLKLTLNPIESVTMYRMYNPNSGEHFYTANAAERDNLKAVGWNYEGVAWTAPKTSNTPVYRLYNKNSGEHHYTTNAAEKNMLLSVGWSDEGIGWYSDDNKTTVLYRLYNPNAKGAQEAGAHHYTTNEAEKDSLRKVGWNYEGYGWYGL